MAAMRMLSRLLQVDDGFYPEALELPDHVVLENVDGIRPRDRHNLVCAGFVDNE